jgi:hypothetical protein
VTAYTFASFVNDVEWRVRALTLRLSDADFNWPGVLILDAAGGLSAESFVIGASTDERDRLVLELADRIRAARARRFAWVMPCVRRQRANGEEEAECLLIVCGERGRAEALVAEVQRAPGRAPRLGRFSRGAFGSGARRISGRFVEPLLDALKLLIEDVPEGRLRV